MGPNEYVNSFTKNKTFSKSNCLLVVCVVYLKAIKLRFAEADGSLRGCTCKRRKLRLLEWRGDYGKIDFNS